MPPFVAFIGLPWQVRKFTLGRIFWQIAGIRVGGGRRCRFWRRQRRKAEKVISEPTVLLTFQFGTDGGGEVKISVELCDFNMPSVPSRRPVESLLRVSIVLAGSG